MTRAITTAVLVGLVLLAATATVAPARRTRDPLPLVLREVIGKLPRDLATAPKSLLNSTLHTIFEELAKVPVWAEFVDKIKQLGEVAKTCPKDATLLDPDCFRTHCESAEAHGYGCESHTVQTSDGFLLDVFRIFKASPVNKPPVLLSHGLVDTSFSWIFLQPNSSLAYLLADAGYDVWLGNARGNKHSTDHVRYGEFDKELWDFTFDQQGQYDVPETIDYILLRTGQPKLAVVGHSQGCSQLFSAAQQHPSLDSKIALFVALAPAGYFDYLTNMIIELAASTYLADILEFFGVDKFLYLPDLVEDAIPYVCNAAPNIVLDLLSLLMGSNPGEIDPSRVAVGCAQSLGWTSMRNMVHWSQLVRDENFLFFDYGYFGNRDHYGQGSPPAYDINSHWPQNIPVAVFYGGNDELVTPRDAEDVINDIPKSSLVFRKYVDSYAHLDFTWGTNAHKNIYNETLTLMQAYLPTNQ